MPVEPRDTAEWLRERHRAEQARAAAEAERARQVLPRLAQLLRQRGAKRIWLFGSLAEDRFSAVSDIDLAAEGLEPMAIFGLRQELILLAGRSVDLIRTEDCVRSLKDRIHRFGEEIR